MLIEEIPVALLALVFLTAVLYSSVGHGGASGYIAAMALFGLSPAIMKPAALTMNVFVAGLVLLRLVRAGHFDWRLFLPFALASTPLAYLGGAWTITDISYRYVVGVALLIAALRFLVKIEYDGEVRSPALWVSVPVGGLLGFVSGLTGVGGGVYLSPLLLLLRWTTMRASAAIVAAFILVNSLAGLAGHAAAGATWPPGLTWYVGAAVAGAVIGSEFAVRRFSPMMLRKVLGVVLVIAGAKMLYTA